MAEHNPPEEMDVFFDARAAGYDAHMHASLADAETYYRKLAEPIAQTTEPIAILDVGCGTGLELPAVLEKAPNARLTCIDLSQEMLKRLRRKFPDVDITVIKGSYLTHDFGIPNYEVILSSMTFHHLTPEQKRALYANLHKALKTDGVYIEGDYIVAEEKMNRLMAQYRALPGKAKGGTHHIDIPLSLALQVDLLGQAGFVAVKEIYTHGENVILTAMKK